METDDDADVDAPDETNQDRTGGGDRNREPRHASKNIKLRHRNDVFIAEGFYTDCENLLKQFLANQTSTFEDFVTIWQAKKFPLIFNGRDSHSELLEFSEEALIIAKSFILPPHSQIKRIGALYLMYGLFTQQPYRETARYRVTPQEWSVILKFVESLKAHGFIDANYIFHKMCLDGAFLTVSHAREYGLERNYRKYLMNWQAREKELEPGVNFSLETLMGRVCRGSLKSAADNLLTKYNNIKKVIADKKGTNFQSIKGTEKELEQVMLQNMTCTNDSNNQTLDDAKRLSNLGVGRRNIIKKAFTNESHQKGSQCALLLDTAATSAASTSQTNDVTAISNDELESVSDSDDSDLEHLINPPSMRNNSRKQTTSKSKQGKSQTREQLPSLGEVKRGPRSLDSCYEEVTGLKTSRGHRPSPVKTGPSLELVEESDSSRCPKAAKLKLPASGKSGKKRKLSNSLSVPLLLPDDTESSMAIEDPLSCTADTATTKQAKKRGRGISGVKKDVTANLGLKDTCPSSETPVDKPKKSTRRSRKSISPNTNSPKKSARILAKSISSKTNDASPSLESPKERPAKSTGKSRKSNVPKATDSSAGSETPENKSKTSLKHEPEAIV